MGEQLGSPELRPEPRLVTGIFSLSHPYFTQRALQERRALRIDEEPIFAVRDISVIHDLEGWHEFTQTLYQLLPEEESTALDLEQMQSVNRAPLENVTDLLEPGQIHRLTPEQYAEAYQTAYGNTIIIPTY